MILKDYWTFPVATSIEACNFYRNQCKIFVFISRRELYRKCTMGIYSIDTAFKYIMRNGIGPDKRYLKVRAIYSTITFF
jgi:hypothetical protein